MAGGCTLSGAGILPALTVEVLMGWLRDQMEATLRLRNASPRTTRMYLGVIRRLAAFYLRSPAELDTRAVTA